MTHNTVPLNRALSKLGVMSRAEATRAIAAGRVSVDGRVVTDGLTRVVPERARIVVDGRRAVRCTWRTIVFHKPRGVMTTRRDPDKRRTIYDVLGEHARGLNPVGRLDFATTGLLLLTSDTRLANWIADPANDVPRIYAVSVRGRIDESHVTRLVGGVVNGRVRLSAHEVTLRKASARESHLLVELREGKNREVRRLFDAIGREVTKLKRVKLGGIDLGRLAPGEWREVSAAEILAAFPGSARAISTRSDPQRP